MRDHAGAAHFRTRACRGGHRDDRRDLRGIGPGPPVADVFEAVVAAVYLDGGFSAAWDMLTRLFPQRLEEVELTGYYDHKTRLHF